MSDHEFDYDYNLDYGDVREQMRVYDEEEVWNIVYERLKNRSTVINKDASTDAARDVQNRWKNRYRDVSPYDATRVFLCDSFDGDYINASFVCVPKVPSRRYILTQGPMQQTVKHFWLMVWEQRCPAIIMLNRIIEKDSIRCHPYFPYEKGPSFLEFTEIGLQVELVSELNMKCFVQRIFNIIHLKSNEFHRVVHMHYTNWPDFGVPNSPSGMLNFLWAVRALGVLDNPQNPSVIHCSAGVGRSGAFVLIDLALFLIEQENSMDNVKLANLFLDLRKCRMGIIQTADQLRFCYRAIIKAADKLLITPTDQRLFIKFEPDPDEKEESSINSSLDESDSSEDDVNSFIEDLDEFDTEENNENGIFNHINQIDSSFGEIKSKDEQITLSNNIVTPWLLDPSLPTPSDSLLCNSTQSVFSTNPNSKESKLSTWTENISSIKSNVPELNLNEDVDISLLQPLEKVYLHSHNRDRSNNAVPMAFLTDASANQQDSSNTVSETVETTSFSSLGSAEHDNTPSETPTFNPDGDSSQIFEQEAPNDVAEAIILGTTPAGAGSDLTSDEYLVASIDLHQRRVARLTRQMRMRERIENMRSRMRAADLERKRWLPARILHYLRRFYSESGYIQSTTGAVVSSLVMVAAISFGTYLYALWSSKYHTPSPPY